MLKNTESNKTVYDNSDYFELSISLNLRKPLEEIKRIFNQNTIELLNQDDSTIEHLYYLSQYNTEIFEYLLEKTNNKMTEEMFIGILYPYVQNLKNNEHTISLIVLKLLYKFNSLLTDVSKIELIQMITNISSKLYEPKLKLVLIKTIIN